MLKHAMSRGHASTIRGSRRRAVQNWRLLAGGIGRHRHRDLIGDTVERAADRVDAKPEHSVENDIARGLQRSKITLVLLT